MKNKILLLVLFPAIVMLLQGCYTELATNEDNSGYGSYSEEQQSSSNNSNYDIYPPSTYWGFQYYYPSWSSFWIYERWYYDPYVWYTPWYDPWFGAAIVVYPAPYWYYHYYYPGYWGWHDGGYGYGKPSVPRTWGSQRPSNDNNYRDFGPSRSSGEGGSNQLTIPSAGRVTGSSRSGEAAPSRQQSSEATESPRGVSTGQTAAPSRSSDAPRQTEQRGAVTRQSQSQSDDSTPSRSSSQQEQQQSGNNSGATRSRSSGSSEG
nr:hypothetical protein [Bacteroidota bacterium]